MYILIISVTYVLFSVWSYDFMFSSPKMSLYVSTGFCRNRWEMDLEWCQPMWRLTTDSSRNKAPQTGQGKLA
jgi:hypothetical protein